jgi:hypothetical protein
MLEITEDIGITSTLLLFVLLLSDILPNVRETPNLDRISRIVAE